MAYVGGRLASFFHDEPVQPALARIAARGGDRLVEWTVRNTPIGGREVAGQGGGNLRTSWYQQPVTRARRGPLTGWESGVATDSDYAPHVEHGTGLWGPEHKKYLIEPKDPVRGWLHWIDPRTGEDVFAKRVWHPGSPGQHMVAIAVQMVEGEFDTLFDGILGDWARMTEAMAD